MPPLGQPFDPLDWPDVAAAAGLELDDEPHVIAPFWCLACGHGQCGESLTLRPIIISAWPVKCPACGEKAGVDEAPRLLWAFTADGSVRIQAEGWQ